MEVRYGKNKTDNSGLVCTISTFDFFFRLANVGFFTFSSKTPTLVPTSNANDVRCKKHQINL